jgi:hypothetical protein
MFYEDMVDQDLSEQLQTIEKKLDKNFIKIFSQLRAMRKASGLTDEDIQNAANELGIDSNLMDADVAQV